LGSFDCEGTLRKAGDDQHDTATLGRIVATPGALKALEAAGENRSRFLRRHQHGDWGDLHRDDEHANMLTLRRGMRLLSAYVLSTGERIRIITEGDRSSTCILTQEEY
jgi:hypothetical protein